MKKAWKSFLIYMVLLALLAGCTAPAATVQAEKSAAPVVAASPAAPAVTTPSMAIYKDGKYDVKCANDSENYYVKGSVTIQDSKISAVEWAIYDANRNDKLFDKNYEAVFAGNDTYIQQCRDNLAGMVQYAPKLIETQNIAEVDSISGATWTYNKFKQLVAEGLKQASAK